MTIEVTTEELLEHCSFMCARKIEKFSDLVPMEVEALLRANQQTLRRYKVGLERLSTGEAFTIPQAMSPEIGARIEFARDVLAGLSPFL